MTDEQWLAIRKEEGLKIDPATAEVDWIYAQVIDPYGLIPSAECYCVGREYFARAPGSAIWVNLGDLPEATRDALWGKHKQDLASRRTPQQLGRTPDLIACRQYLSNDERAALSATKRDDESGVLAVPS
jgi:hypothetical protein